MTFGVTFTVQARNQKCLGGGGVSKIRVSGASRSTARERSDGAGGGLGGGVPPARAGKNLHLGPEKTVSYAYFGQRLLEYDFLQIARGRTSSVISMPFQIYS